MEGNFVFRNVSFLIGLPESAKKLGDNPYTQPRQEDEQEDILHPTDPLHLLRVLQDEGSEKSGDTEKHDTFPSRAKRHPVITVTEARG